jgi:hypothetical protein
LASFFRFSRYFPLFITCAAGSVSAALLLLCVPSAASLPLLLLIGAPPQNQIYQHIYYLT